MTIRIKESNVLKMQAYQRYLKISLKSEGPKLIGKNALAQSNTQMRWYIFKHPAHLGTILRTWAAHRLSHQDMQFSTFSLLVTSQPSLTETDISSWCLETTYMKVVADPKWVSVSKQSINIGNKW